MTITSEKYHELLNDFPGRRHLRSDYRHAASCGLPIYLLDQLAKDPVDLVFVTALAYEQEILAGLRESGFTGTIAVLGESVRIAQP